MYIWRLRYSFILFFLLTFFFFRSQYEDQAPDAPWAPARQPRRRASSSVRNTGTGGHMRGAHRTPVRRLTSPTARRRLDFDQIREEEDKSWEAALALVTPMVSMKKKSMIHFFKKIFYNNKKKFM